ncbi:MAG: dicarboxylate/amino acid:cation symporter [Alphaproteobacteria bacterium]
MVHEVKSEFGEHLWLKILIGMLVGVIVGLLLSPYGGALVDSDTAYQLAAWLKLPGVFFLGMIQMVVIPLILCSIILGITQSGEIEFLKKIGWRIVAYFIGTTTIAIIIGIGLVNVIKPGTFIDPSLVQNFQEEMLLQNVSEVKTFEDLTIPQRISNIIPVNVPGAMVERNLLQIVVAAMIVGIALLTMPSASTKPVIDLCISGQGIAMTVIGWAMKIAPFAVFGLLCDIMIKLGVGALAGMGMYMLTVIAGLLAMACVYVLIVMLIGRYDPIRFIKGAKEAQLLAFSTSSSAATMPFTLSCVEENMGADPKIARFVVPLGATINMDGTALYQAVAALFLVQVFGVVSGVELSNTDIVLLMITTVGASIGTPATPGVGIVVLATILTGIGLHPAAVGFIFGVDRILDMCRTTVNVTGDMAATIVMQRWLK